ncbi:unnamed protein product [Parascedosporium putredinis]|uniref:Uncharacterized protein n=1 Tax=Parascedosporium putredinis TaxID=1442378 RepID=A0A9P1M5R4_9PEZI|nr:unnamed protein product [Parascedosporium putredinis]CAI7987565.1 unnamed protein product [Parascedosporium putredinis]
MASLLQDIEPKQINHGRANGGPSLVQDPEMVTNSDDPSNNVLDTTLISTNGDSSASEKRQSTDSSNTLITEIHRTVSLIHVFRPDGTPVEIKTVYSPLTTVLVDPTTGAIVESITDNAGAAAVEPVVPTPPLVTNLPNSGDLTSPGDESILPVDPDLLNSLSDPFSETDVTSGTPTVSSFTLMPTGYFNEEGPAVNDANSTNDGPTPTSTVVGSVVGSVAGAAFIIFAIMALLRWRKRQSGRLRLVDEPGSGTRGLVTDGGNGDGGTGGGGMMQHMNPFAAPAVLSTLSSYKAAAGTSKSKSQNTGFHRISGKKLPSVLQYGGDGFTDPRASTMSGASSMYHDQPPLVDVDGSGAPILALGNPMRPVSGVVMMRSSPARTPVTEQNPFMDPARDPFADPRPPPAPPTRTLRPDAVGRSLTAQDLSRGSSSRFMEDV